ncbi:hypothetical protein HY634_04075 [Candidatus Uhrbacteria bacterium]|nr:hypothetical protein [Candidatus Uhrbacteria bacterium]
MDRGTALISSVALVALLTPRLAHAYIDLGLAGQVFQLASVGLLALAALVLSPILFFWKNLIRWAKAKPYVAIGLGFLVAGGIVAVKFLST